MEHEPSAPAPEKALRQLGLALVDASWSLQGKGIIPERLVEAIGDFGDALLDVRFTA